MFEHPELCHLATAIEAAKGAIRLPPIEAQAADAPKLLSFAQQRLWFLDQFEGQASATYNMPMALRLSGALNVDALRHSLHWLLERHESLRYCFPAQDGQATVRILPMETFDGVFLNSTALTSKVLPIRDLRQLSPQSQQQEMQALATAHAVAPFDLAGGQLFKAELLLLDEHESVLLLNMHHIISDGWSMGVFMRDWQHAYAAFALGNEPSLPPLAIQYSDYAAWQRQWFQGEVLERQVAYWIRQLDGLPELLELPTDKPRPPQQSYRGGGILASLCRWRSARRWSP